MRKITFLFLLFAFVSYGQKKHPLNVNLNLIDESITIEQYDLLSKINSYYSEVVISKNVKNIYKMGTAKKIVSTLVVCNLPNDFKLYELRIGHSNLNLDYQYETVDGGFSYGSYNLMGNDVFKTEYYLKSDFKISRFYRNGKLLFSDSPENEVGN